MEISLVISSVVAVAVIMDYQLLATIHIPYNIFLNQACVWFLEVNIVCNVYVSACVCVSALKAGNN